MENLIEKQLIVLLKEWNVTYEKIESKESLYKIFSLFNNDVVELQPTTTVEQLYFGVYYKNKKKDEETAKKYYLMAIDGGSSFAMNNVAICYENDGDYDKAKKYYLMGVAAGNVLAMRHFAIYYRYVETQPNLMRKYFRMAIKKGDAKSAFELGNFYIIDGPPAKIRKYYLLAIELGSIEAIGIFGNYYNKVEGNFEMAKKYYLMGVELGDSTCMNNLAVCYNTRKEKPVKMVELYLKAIQVWDCTKREKMDGCGYAACNLANYYYEHGDIGKMKFYYGLVIERGFVLGVKEFASYYLNAEKNPVEALNLYIMYPDKYGVEIQSIAALYPSAMIEVLTKQRQEIVGLKHEVRDLKLVVEDLKYRPDREELDLCKQRFERQKTVV